MTAPAPAAPSATARVMANARRVAPLQWKLLAVFLVVGIVGGVLYVVGATQAPTAAGAGPVPAGASGFVGSATPSAAPASTDASWTAWSGGQAAKLGFGFVGGFVVGFIFRAFIKMMTLFTILIVAGLALLSYYHVLNIDFTAAEKLVQTNSEWLTDQAVRLKDVLLAHLPSSGGGAAGAFLGLRRR